LFQSEQGIGYLYFGDNNKHIYKAPLGRDFRGSSTLAYTPTHFHGVMSTAHWTKEMAIMLYHRISHSAK